MNLEDIIYQSLLYFSFFLFGILGLSFIIHLFRKQPVKKIEINKSSTAETKDNLNTELIIAAKKREEIIAEAQRKRALKIEKEKRREEYRRSRYSVVMVNEKKKHVVAKPIFNSTVIQNRSLEFYQ